ncbi:Secretin and TonB N terminus short domain-containing protein [Lampropedia hyalina DSM 16112]|uniref:Secretin and TonB N terminus short domain-containing protein n=1 Tax=Lampropedia hyalina DSM 16112 TaxID=1122156 RepID=A0A1M5DTG7_9BURK|nr:TonB-dependent receptor plug domain-containing protein [Lampropedia hyalina]SHF70205.1 Secretin and TonB N terminus short domain-containing protein [Lampropedia hyalina DSM 16112]
MGLRHQLPRHSIGRNFRSAPSDHICNSRSLDHPRAPAFRLNALVLAGTCVLTGLGGTLALAPQAVQAAEPAAAAGRDYAIPAGRLSDALAQFAAASGVALSFDPQALQGQQSTGLQGSYTVQQGFARLLDGTGWWVQPQQGNTYTLQNTPASSTRGTSEPGTLPEVVVMADATQPGYPAEAYVGGQVARGSRVGLLGNKDMLDTPFNVTSYTSELIHNQQAYSLADVMENNPAVQVVNGAARNTETFVMRGFPTGMSNVALNGVYGLVPVYRILPDYIDRVEVLNGPNALLGGMTKG